MNIKEITTMLNKLSDDIYFNNIVSKRHTETNKKRVYFENETLFILY